MGQNALNEQQNTDDNTHGGIAPTTQAIFGDNQKLRQTQEMLSADQAHDSVTNLMQNLSDSARSLWVDYNWS